MIKGDCANARLLRENAPALAVKAARKLRLLRFIVFPLWMALLDRMIEWTFLDIRFAPNRQPVNIFYI
jgi:hypothetical protein